MGSRKYETGDKFGKWTLIEYLPTRSGKVYWRVQCECGAIKDVFSGNITRGKSTQCSDCSYKERVADECRFGFPLHIRINV